MRADTHDGPEQIAPLQRPDTLMQLSRSLILEVHLVPHGRAIHMAPQADLGGTTRCTEWGWTRQAPPLSKKGGDDAQAQISVLHNGGDPYLSRARYPGRGRV